MEILLNTSAEIKTTGKLKFDEHSFNEAVSGLSQSKTRNVRILVIQDYKNATKKQLAYYHGILLKDVISAFESIGEELTEVEVDKYMRENFLFEYHTNLHSGHKRKIVRTLDSGSETFPSTKEISVYFENIVRFCSINMGYIIYLPEDLKDIDLNFDR